MLNIVISNQMKKDLKLAKRRGYDINALKEYKTYLSLGITGLLFYPFSFLLGIRPSLW